MTVAAASSFAPVYVCMCACVCVCVLCEGGRGWKGIERCVRVRVYIFVKNRTLTKRLSLRASGCCSVCLCSGWVGGLGDAGGRDRLFVWV